MPRMTSQLTNTQVKQAKKAEKEYTLSDGSGLQLRVRPTGSKLWILKYTHPLTKKRTNLGLGSYPDISLAEARRKRAEAKKLLTSDVDVRLAS